ncbi:histidine phosphatase family protein [Streptococcus caprae]|uniref:Histidine phosphatase family protein n=1 Tax=Streptococcus caprae TaxID=1640501 RepID=A0ABV8CTD4_9STRE
MKKRLYLMKHGQTLFNQLGRIQGWCDSPLTSLGREQALLARHFFKDEGIKFDRYYSSSSERCCETMQIATGQTSFIRLKGLKDWNFGRMEGQQECLFPNRNSIYESFDDFYLQFDGESEGQFRSRISRTIRSIIDELDNGETALAITNTGVIIQLLKYLKLEQYLDHTFSHATIFEFIIGEEEYKLARILDIENNVLTNRL